MNCGDCKHWDRTTRPVREMMKYMSNIKGTDLQIGECMKIGGNSASWDDWLAVAICDSEGISGELITGEQFGCVLWEAKG